MLPAYDEFSPNIAVILLLPTGNLEVVNVAIPLFSVALPIEAVPFLNIMAPVGVAPDAAATVAVNVTAWPAVDGFRLDVRVMVVAIFWTVCDKEAVLPA